MIAGLQGRGLLLQGVPGGRPSHASRAPRAALARARLLTHPRPLTFPLNAPPRCRQTAAWKAGHKHECGAPGQGAAAAKLRSAARAGAALAEAARAPAGLTAEQIRLVTRLHVLEDAGNWLGVVALEREALALARDRRGADPGLAGAIHSNLGLGYYSTGDYGRACELHEQHRAICEALGDHAGVAMHEKHRAMAEALGDRAGVARACGNLGQVALGQVGTAGESMQVSALSAVCAFSVFLSPS